MTQGMYNEPHTEVILLHKHQHLISYIASSPGVPSPLVLQATVGGGEDLGSAIMHHTTPSRSPHNALHSPSYYYGISVVRIPYVFRLQFNATARRMRSISNIFAL